MGNKCWESKQKIDADPLVSLGYSRVIGLFEEMGAKPLSGTEMSRIFFPLP